MKKKKQEKEEIQAKKSYNVFLQNRVKNYCFIFNLIICWGYCRFSYNACVIINRVKITTNF